MPGCGQGPGMTLPPKGAPNTMGGCSHSRTYLHLCVRSPYLTCQDPVFSQEQAALGPLVVIGAVIIGRCLQQRRADFQPASPGKSGLAGQCGAASGATLEGGPMRSQRHLAFDLSSLRNAPESPAEGEGSCQATRLVKSRAGTQTCSYLVNSRL